MSETPAPSRMLSISEIAAWKKTQDALECPSMTCACRKRDKWIDYNNLPAEASATASAYIGCPVLICSINEVKTELAYINSLSFVGRILARNGLRSFYVLTFASFRCLASVSFQSAAQKAKKAKGVKKIIDNSNST